MTYCYVTQTAASFQSPACQSTGHRYGCALSASGSLMRTVENLNGLAGPSNRLVQGVRPREDIHPNQLMDKSLAHRNPVEAV